MVTLLDNYIFIIPIIFLMSLTIGIMVFSKLIFSSYTEFPYIMLSLFTSLIVLITLGYGISG